MSKNLLFFLSLMFLVQAVHAQSVFYFQNEGVDPGTKRHFIIPVTDGTTSTFIPVTVFNGMEDGETLGITAGIHGYEYPPILAAQRLISSIDPLQLKGVVILVQVANVEGFLGRSPYTNPIDGKNLNRSFPGAEEGKITDRIAHFITQNIIARSAYFLDIHAGDAPEDLMSYSAFYTNSQKQEVSQKGKEMALALGFDHVVVFTTDGKDYMKKDKPSLYTSAEAFKRNIPSIDIECGRLGRVEEEDVTKIETAVLNLLGRLDFMPRKRVEVKSPIIIRDRIYIAAEHEGIFYPEKKAGEYVTKGMRLGVIRDFFGEELQTVYAAEEGLLLLIIGTPPVRKGEDVAVIGRVGDR